MRPKMASKKPVTPQGLSFTYVVARPWENPSDGLAIYAYHGEVKRGTLAEAENFLEFVRNRTNDPKEREAYGIYVVGFTKIA